MITGMGIFIECRYGSEMGIGVSTLHNILEPTRGVTLLTYGNNGFNSDLKVSSPYNIGHNKWKELLPTKLQFNP
jgi:hypothetical protein